MANMKSASAARAERAKSRAEWPVRKYSLGSEPGDNLSAWTTAAERLGMMWGLARQAWLLTGRPLPRYSRARAPGRIVRASG